MNTKSFISTRYGLLGSTLIFTAIASCTWVKETNDGGAVAIATEESVTECELVGTTVSKVKDSVGFVNRSSKKVEKELTTLAKNEAATMGGNRIVTQTEVVDGRQEFKVYLCK